jgi:hypothetical protein
MVVFVSMKMVLTIGDAYKPSLVQRIKDGGNNSLVIDGRTVDPADWRGTGSYNFDKNGKHYSIKKASSSYQGELTLKKVTDYDYEIVPAVSNVDVITTLNAIFPIGSVYLSTSSTMPDTYFPGTTWSRLGVFGMSEDVYYYKRTG